MLLRGSRRRVGRDEMDEMDEVVDGGVGKGVYGIE